MARGTGGTLGGVNWERSSPARDRVEDAVGDPGEGWGRPRGRQRLLLGLMIALAACGEGGPGEVSTHTVQDSAGVRIVENSAPAWGEGEEWAFSSEPLLGIGVLEGPEEYMLFRARGALHLSDGRTVMINSGTQELRFYGADGLFLGSTGAEGEGPGEFRSLGFLWRSRGDSLVVYDLGLRRFSVFGDDGAYARSFLLSSDESQLAFPEGVFEDGSVLAAVDEGDQGNYGELGVLRGVMRFGRYGREGALEESLVSLPGSELFKGTHPDGSGFTTSRRHAVRPFSAVGPNTWYYGSGDTFEFQERGRDGTLRQIVRLPKERRSMPQAVRSAWEENLREMSPSGRAIWGAVPLPDSLPTHQRLVLDREGCLWVQSYTVLDEEPHWSVLEPSGRWLGDLALPEGLNVTEIGADYVMGIWADTLGVEQVRMYGLDRGNQ